MITIDDFQILPFNKQCDFITVFADYLAYRVEDDKKYYLYAMENYFVEVAYLPVEGTVLSINAFHSANDLEEYLQFIDISDLAG
ncbi:MAG: hypothetical protein AAF149_17015 [Bacteroidota bacterium]